MKIYPFQSLLLFTIISTAILFSACFKDDLTTGLTNSNAPPQSTVPPVPPSQATTLCANRPIVAARLVTVGSLSVARIGMVSAAAGNKILFAGGAIEGAYSSRVDIYDIVNNHWSAAELTIPERDGMVAATVGNKILFAGGGDHDNGTVTSRVDIYDVSNNTWSVAELSKGREFLAAATVGDKVFFAGGYSGVISTTGDPRNSNIVDIYHDATNTWTTATLSEGRSDISATTVGNKIYFAGGFPNLFHLTPSRTIDIYDASTNSWSTSQLVEAKGAHTAITEGNKIFWAGGIGINYLSNQVEIKDVATGRTSMECIIPNAWFNAVIKKDNIVFFTGGLGLSGSHLAVSSDTHFDIYNTTTNQWSTGVLDKKVIDAAIISVNETIYVAGGRDKDHPGGPNFREVWKLEF